MSEDTATKETAREQRHMQTERLRQKGELRNTWQELSRKRNIPFWKGLALRPWRKRQAQPPPVSITPSSERFSHCSTGKEVGQETLTHLLHLSTSVSMFDAISLRRINSPPPSIVLLSWNSAVIHFKGLRSFKHVRGLMGSQRWEKPEEGTQGHNTSVRRQAIQDSGGFRTEIACKTLRILFAYNIISHWLLGLHDSG